MRLRPEIQALSRQVELNPVDGNTVRVAVDVVVGVLADDDGRVLIAQRPPGKQMAGAWEFPGGKRLDGEPAFDALRRELREELGVDVVRAEPLIELEHDYTEARVRLDVWWIAEYRNEPAAIENQALRWVSAIELGDAALLPADGPIVDCVRARLGAPPL